NELPTRISDPSPKPQTDQTTNSTTDTVQTPTVQEMAAKVSTLAPPTIVQPTAAPDRPDNSTTPVASFVPEHEQERATSAPAVRESDARINVGQNLVQHGDSADTVARARTGSLDSSTALSADPPEERDSKTA